MTVFPASAHAQYAPYVRARCVRIYAPYAQFTEKVRIAYIYFPFFAYGQTKVFSAFSQFSPTETKIAVFEQNNHNRSGVSSFGSESRVPKFRGVTNLDHVYLLSFVATFLSPNLDFRFLVFNR